VISANAGGGVGDVNLVYHKEYGCPDDQLPWRQLSCRPAHIATIPHGGRV